MDFQFCQPFKDYDDDLYAKYSHKGNNMLKNIDFDTLRLRDYFEANKDTFYVVIVVKVLCVRHKTFLP